MDKNDMVIISVDDHVSEPADMFDNHLSGEALASAPKLKTADNGTNYWEYQGLIMPATGLNAVAGRVPEEYGMEPTHYDQLRRGVWDVHARIDDMNADGIAGSMNFGSCLAFEGGVLHRSKDKQKALVHLRAYNDWMIDEWCGAYPGRLIPCCLLPTWDMAATVEEVKRISAKGCHAVSLNENPTKQGLPSIHNAYWEPLFKAVTDSDVVMCLHIGAGNPAPHASMETPIEAWITTMPMSVAVGAADWLYLEALERYPTMKIAMSEGGIGWIPYFLERVDFVHEHHKAWTHSGFERVKPSELFKKHFMTCFIKDAFGLKNLVDLNEDMVAFESDYPHSDSVWPRSADILWDSVKALSDAQIDKVTHRNAMRFFDFDLFGHAKREELTVGALRAQAAARKVDVTPKSHGGARPLAKGEAPRKVTSGDIVGMFQRHAEMQE
jgi:predicted TIM-barrel fold metal-dependent hydrolase